MAVTEGATSSALSFLAKVNYTSRLSKVCATQASHSKTWHRVRGPKGTGMKTPASLTPRPLGWSLIGHLSWVGLLAIVAATTMNVLIGYLAIMFLDISKTFFVLIGYLALTALGISGLFLPLSWYGTIVPFTVVGVAGATAVYAIIICYSPSPIRLFSWIAGVALMLSFIPDISLLALSVAGTTPLSVGVLMLMHVSAFLVSFGMLTRLVPPN